MELKIEKIKPPDLKKNLNKINEAYANLDTIADLIENTSLSMQLKEVNNKERAKGMLEFFGLVTNKDAKNQEEQEVIRLKINSDNAIIQLIGSSAPSRSIIEGLSDTLGCDKSLIVMSGDDHTVKLNLDD